MSESYLWPPLPWMEEDETLLAFRRRHPYTLALKLLIPAFLLALPLAFWALTSDYGPSATHLLSLSYLFLGPLGALLFLWFYLDWLNDYCALTNRRLVWVEKVVFLSERREEMALERVQEVTLRRPHLLARLLGFGDIMVESAGTEGRLLLSSLPEPDQVREEILAQVERSRKGRPEEVVERSVMAIQPGVSPLPRGALALLIDYLFPKMRLEEGSTVTWRKHWYILLRKTVGASLLLILLLEVGVAVALGLPLFSFLPRSTALGLVVTLASLLALVILYQYEDWRNDIYVLTDDRIIDIDRKPLFLQEERREASLAMIQDVKYVIPGIIYNLLNVGRVLIETAGTAGEFTFDWVHDPRRVQAEVFARLEAFREREKEEERKARAAELRELLQAYKKMEESPSDEGEAQE